MGLIWNKIYRINLAAGESVLIRTYRIYEGVRVYTNIAKIDSDGNLITIGEVRSNQVSL